ncbi:MAG: sigma-E factor negative regulatory protein [Acidovorax sp.]|jgi:sigma-E factor negative regulatory protein RseA|uniref:sigma-E factor negative regulatory protein n=1 Tax=Acidovorax sp. TaxID=1872122 RepID=UPI0026059AD1|nr:sigma-E factor negative regulatory protein [Acidovorax sp.]MDH4465355.1 sigma-E factor negative regulatory protein [Acidovorax sp.]
MNNSAFAGKDSSAVEREQSERELLSALADGELRGEELQAALDLCARDQSQATWELYHLAGDVLRSPDLARPVNSAFMSRLRDQLGQEPSLANVPLAVEEPSVVRLGRVDEASNASVFRWKMVAGFASLAAVAAVGWTSLAGIQGGTQGPASASQQLAAAPAATATTLNPAVVAVADADGQQVMIRDPRLDELLAAHKQFGSTSALQMPAGFLRNATFESPGR